LGNASAGAGRAGRMIRPDRRPTRAEGAALAPPEDPQPAQHRADSATAQPSPRHDGLGPRRPIRAGIFIP
jgi:hypothetical protein